MLAVLGALFANGIVTILKFVAALITISRTITVVLVMAPTGMDWRQL